MTPASFATAVMNLCDALGGSTERYIETAARARKRTGTDHCPHLYGLGADLVYDIQAPLSSARQRAEFFGLRLERGLGYDHVEPLSWRPADELPSCVAIVAAVKKPGARAVGRDVITAARAALEPPMSVVIHETPTLPRQLRESTVVIPIDAGQVDVIATETIGCPACGIARAFFVLTKASHTAPWRYQCLHCHRRLAKATA